MFETFSWRHLPAILTATPMLLGGLVHGIARPRQALLTWGMTEKTADSREAQVVYYGHSMRTSTLGLLVFAFYFAGNLVAVDTVMAVMGTYCGIADILVIWYHGNRSVLPIRTISIFGIAAWGLAGLTSQPLG